MVKFQYIQDRNIKHDKGFIANFLLNLNVKEFLKLANVCQSYE